MFKMQNNINKLQSKVDFNQFRSNNKKDSVLQKNKNSRDNNLSNILTVTMINIYKTEKYSKENISS